MEKIGLLIDSTTITRDDLREPFIKVASLNIMVDGKDKRELDFTNEEIIKVIHTHAKVTTSQPSPGEFVSLLEAFKEEGYTHVLVVPLSKNLSGTHQSATMANEMMEGLTITIVDTNLASYGVAQVVRVLADDIKKSVSFVELVTRANRLFSDASVMFTIGDLMHLYRGGRLSKASAIIGKALRIKPVIEMIDGRLEMIKKERTNQACYQLFMDKIASYVAKYDTVWVDIISLNRWEFNEKIRETIAREYPKVIIHQTDYVSPVFFVHLGDQGFGISVMAE